MSRRIGIALPLLLGSMLAPVPGHAVPGVATRKARATRPVSGLVSLAVGRVSTGEKPAAEKSPAPGPDEATPGTRATPGPLTATVGKGLVSREELFARLRAALPGGPADPNAPAVLEALIDELKQRGVQYFKVVPAEIHRLVRPDPKLDLVAAIEHNYGSPCKSEWLLGTWNLLGVGGPVDYQPGEGYVYRQKESAAKSGSLTLNADGTYRWKPGPDEAVITGTWREATPAEMWLQGGAGAVLLDGESGQDWIARRAINRSFKGAYLDVASLDLRFRGGKRRIGKRQ